MQLGDDIKTVVAACGKPLNTTKNKPNATEGYDIYTYTLNHPNLRQNPAQTFAVIVHQATVTAIRNMQEPGVARSMPCTNGPVYTGTSLDTLFAHCGKQSPTKHLDLSNGPGETLAGTTVLLYRRSVYEPAQNFIFKNDKLIQITQGDLQNNASANKPLLLMKKLKEATGEPQNKFAPQAFSQSPTQYQNNRKQLNLNSGIFNPHTVKSE